jgi:hypothetical protein
MTEVKGSCSLPILTLIAISKNDTILKHKIESVYQLNIFPFTYNL